MKKTYQVLRENIRFNLYNGIAWGIGFNLFNPFIGIYAARLGATNTQFALLSSIPALLTVLITFPAAFIIEQFRHQKRIAVGLMMLARMGYLLVALIPWTSQYQVTTLIYLMGLSTAISTVVGVSYQSIIGEIIPNQYRNQVFSQRNIIIGTVGMVVSLAAGWGIDHAAYLTGYQITFVIAFFAALVEAYYFSRFRIPSEENMVELSSNKLKEPLSTFLQKKLKLLIQSLNIKADRSFYLFCISAVIFVFTWQAAWPVYLKVKVDTLHATNTWISVDTVLGAIGALLGFRPWARLADRYGNGIVLFITALLLALTPFYWIYKPSMLVISIYDFVGGFIVAGLNQTIFNRILELAPNHSRTRAIAFYTSLTQVSAVIAPLIGMKIYEHLTYWMTMTTFGIARIIAAFGFLLVITWFMNPKKSKIGKEEIGIGL